MIWLLLLWVLCVPTVYVLCVWYPERKKIRRRNAQMWAVIQRRLQEHAAKLGIEGDLPNQTSWRLQ